MQRRIGGALALIGGVSALVYVTIFLPHYFLGWWGGVEDLVHYFKDIVWYEQSVSTATHPYSAPWWSWPLLLRACGAYESFIRTHGGATEPSLIAEFLLRDRLFPRSVLHSLVTAEDCLAALNPGPVRMGMDDPARRPVGQQRTRLEYADTGQLTEQLPELLGTLQRACAAACEGITGRYFQYEAPVAWERDG